MGKYKRNNQKGLVFHSEAKQKSYKEERKQRKPYEAPPFSLMLVSFYSFFFAPRILGNIVV